MSLKIVFMGTPEFAVPCLSRVLEDGHTVLGVFTQPDRPKGRGYSLAAPPVKEFALQHNLPVFQPQKLKDGTALTLLRELDPDLIAVVAYGRLLPPDILRLPRMGCVNVHASLLPALRGAAPIQRCIINGDTLTGVATMHMAPELDAGDIILKKETPIDPTETAGELSARLSEMGAALLSETLRLTEAGIAPRTPQDSASATYAPPLTREIEMLDFTMRPGDFCNLVRGLSPSPGARVTVLNRTIKVLDAALADGYNPEPATLLDQKRLIISCGDGAVELLTVQPQGKKPMDGSAWMRGLRR